jgi:hypothetical protein
MDGGDSRSHVGERIWHELNRIANALEALIPEPETTPASEPTCPHPPESRVGLGMTNGEPDWECSICRFRPPT